VVSTDHYRGAGEEFINALQTFNKEIRFDAILAGSVARNCQTPRSDIDVVVVVSDEKLEIPSVEEPIHLVIMSRDGFLGRLGKRDDFAIWCIRYGELILDSGFWTRIRNLPEAIDVWPDWTKKIIQAAKKLIFADQLLRIGDLEAAREEMLYAARHTARAILLKANIFPLSGPEMVTQLSNPKQRHLSELLSALNSNRCTAGQLRVGKWLLKKNLVALDLPKFAEFSKAFIEASRRKALAAKERGQKGADD
jgi:hypothetical protein